MSHCEGVKRPKQSLGVLEFSPILALGILEFLGFKLSCLSLVGRWLAFYCRKPKGQHKFKIPVIASKAKQSWLGNFRIPCHPRALLFVSSPPPSLTGGFLCGILEFPKIRHCEAFKKPKQSLGILNSSLGNSRIILRNSRIPHYVIPSSFGGYF